MAREYARIKVTIWSDMDFRTLSGAAQRLYLFLLTNPALSLAGVADWRPKRIAAMSGDDTEETIRAAARELEERRYVLVDDDTEEILVRSFVRHDSVLSGPKTAVVVPKDASRIASAKLFTAVVRETLRAVQEEPGMKGIPAISHWLEARVADLPDAPPVALPGTQSDTPSDRASDTPSDRASKEYPVSIPIPQPSDSRHNPQPSDPRGSQAPLGVGTVADATPTAKTRAKAKRATRVPESFPVTEAMRKWAADKGITIDIDAATEKFVNHWVSIPGSKGLRLDWNRTWQNWILGDQEKAARYQRSADRPTPSPLNARDAVECDVCGQIYTPDRERHATWCEDERIRRAAS